MGSLGAVISLEFHDFINYVQLMVVGVLGSRYQLAIPFSYQLCSVDGGWGRWEPLSACNKSCDYGYQERRRKCNNPKPEGGGLDCQGIGIEVVPGCNAIPCPGITLILVLNGSFRV